MDLYSVTQSPAASALEARLARRLHEAKLPPLRRQHEIRIGMRRRYLDFAWPEARVGIEVDGYRWHSSRSAWKNDRERLAELRRAGWTVVHATAEDVNGGFEDLVREIRNLLGRRVS